MQNGGRATLNVLVAKPIQTATQETLDKRMQATKTCLRAQKNGVAERAASCSISGDAPTDWV